MKTVGMATERKILQEVQKVSRETNQVITRILSRGRVKKITEVNKRVKAKRAIRPMNVREKINKGARRMLEDSPDASSRHPSQRAKVSKATPRERDLREPARGRRMGIGLKTNQPKQGIPGKEIPGEIRRDKRGLEKASRHRRIRTKREQLKVEIKQGGVGRRTSREVKRKLASSRIGERRLAILRERRRTKTQRSTTMGRLLNS